jgi:hypothetical protein
MPQRVQLEHGLKPLLAACLLGLALVSREAGA